jgi:hypothetical protein
MLESVRISFELDILTFRNKKILFIGDKVFIFTGYVINFILID